MNIIEIEKIFNKKLNVIKTVELKNGKALYVSMSSKGKFMIPYTIISLHNDLNQFSYLYDVRCTWVKIEFTEKNLEEKIDKLCNIEKSYSKDMVMLSEFLKTAVEKINIFDNIVSNIIIGEYSGPCRDFTLVFKIYDKNNIEHLCNLKHIDNIFYIECNDNKKIVIDALFDKAIYSIIKNLI